MSEDDGWTRVTLKSTFGVGRDFAVLDASGEQVGFADGRFGMRLKVDVHDASGAVVLQGTGTLIGIPKRLTVTTPDGTDVATIQAKISPLRSRIVTTLADGTVWDLTGDLIEKSYAIEGPDGPVARIEQKWVTVRDAYGLAVRRAEDLPLVLAVAWAVDAFREQK